MSPQAPATPPVSHTYVVTVSGQDYEVTSPTELSDVQAYQAVKAQADHDQTLASAPGASRQADTYLGGALQGLKEGVVGGATGFVKGVGDIVRHPIDTATDLVSGAVGSIVDTGKGIGHLATDPTGTLNAAGTAIKGIPAGITKAAGEVADKAATNPEGFGRDVGRTTGSTELGMVLAGGFKLAPKPLARSVGGLARTVGQQAKWPLRMVGAHQLGSGNPMGVVTMALPEQIKRGGESLERWGTAEGAATDSAAGTFLQIQQDLRTGAKSPEALLDQATAYQSDLVARRKVAKLPEDIATVQKEQTRLDGLVKQIQRAVGKVSTADEEALSDEELLKKHHPELRLAIRPQPGLTSAPPNFRPVVSVPPAATEAPASVVGRAPIPSLVEQGGVKAPVTPPNPGLARWVAGGGVPEDYPGAAGAPREPTSRLIRTPADWGATDQITRTNQLGAREQGMAAAARRLKDTRLRELIDRGHSPTEAALLVDREFGGRP